MHIVPRSQGLKKHKPLYLFSVYFVYLIKVFDSNSFNFYNIWKNLWRHKLIFNVTLKRVRYRWRKAVRNVFFFI